MTANTAPIFTILPDVTNDHSVTFPAKLTTATGEYDGTSANNVQVHMAGSNGSYVRKLRFKPTGTNVATVARIYLNNNSIHTTFTNNAFFGEVSLPAITATNTAAMVDIDYPMEIALPTSFTIWVGLGTTVANGWICTAIAGQY